MKALTRFRRLRYVVDWKLQGSLVAHGLVYGSMVLAAIGFGIFAPLLWGLSDARLERGFEEQSIVMIYLHDRFWAIALLSLLVVVIGAVRFSHRVAGPMVRYKRNLALLAEGKLPPPLRTRRSDFLKEEVLVLNRAVAGVGERAEVIRRAQREVRRRAGVIAVSQGVEAPEVQRLMEACEQLDLAVQTFHPVDTSDGVALAEELPPAALVGHPGGA